MFMKNMISKITVSNIEFITLKNNGHLKLVLSALGAGIFAIYYDNELMTLSLNKKDDYLNPELYHGKTVGPICGRFAGDTFAGCHYQMNENGVTRHSGLDGLSNQLFHYEIEEKVDTISLIFTYQAFKVTYTIDRNNDSFIVQYQYDGLTQPISLTNHPFFHLGDDFAKLELKIDADYFVETDPVNLVPLRKREIIPCLDFKKQKRITLDINDPYLKDHRTKGYDHYLHFANKKEIWLSNKKYQLHITTDFNGVQIYSDNYDNKEKTIDNRLGIRKALAVEPQDSPLERKKYGSNNIYHRFIKYAFSKK